MRHAAFAILLLTTLASANLAFADTVFSTIQNPCGCGFWFGTGNGTPPTVGTYVISSEFTAVRDYSNITGQAFMYVITGSLPLDVTLSLEADNGGLPTGPVLASTTFLLPVAPLLAGPINFSFSGLTLNDGSNYWLTASSDAVASPGEVNLPDWLAANTTFGTIDANLNGVDNVNTGESMSYALFGTVTGDPIPNGDPFILPPPPVFLPEPSTLLLTVSVGFVGLIALKSQLRRRQTVVTTGPNRFKVHHYLSSLT
jgi:hypothetical protein